MSIYVFGNDTSEQLEGCLQWVFLVTVLLC